jgi:thiosulfate dehydrogenase (quinone)
MNSDGTSKPVNYSADVNWRIISLVIVCVRFAQGWIFWAGGSRRFIYAPQKLNPYDATWLANKLQSAMPGALLGVGSIINYLLQHFYLLYLALVLFSLAELISGLALMLGLFTRLAALTTAFISIALMLVFGWEGSTCLDEWTMAVSNLAMALTLMLSGAASYSIDSWLLRRKPGLAQKRWFITLASGPLSVHKLKLMAGLCLVFTVIFTTATYNYFRGSIFSRYHTGPVSASVLNMVLSNGVVTTNGAVTFMLNVDAGDTAVPGHIIRIELRNSTGQTLEVWIGKALGTLPDADIINKYSYNRIVTGPYGLVAPVSAVAQIKLSPVRDKLVLSAADNELQLYTTDGRRWDLLLQEQKTR